MLAACCALERVAAWSLRRSAWLQDAISFRKLIDEERRERELLTAPGASVTRVAHDLGFADSSSLTHACQRWFSCPPGGLKRTHD